jgi:hypothetical protein
MAELLYRLTAARKTLIETLVAKEEQDRLLLEQLATLREIDQAILAALSVGEIAQAALSRILHLIPSQQAGIIEFDLKTRVVKVLATCSECQTPHSAAALSPIIESSSEVLGDKVIRIPDLATLPQRSPLEQTLYKEGIRSIISVPLSTQAKSSARCIFGRISRIGSPKTIWRWLPRLPRHWPSLSAGRVCEQAEQDARVKQNWHAMPIIAWGITLRLSLAILNTQQRRYMQLEDCPACRS